MGLEQQAIQREQSRFNMVEQQIRPWDVLDPKVLELFKKIPREDFVPKQYKGLAFADIEIPLGEGQQMLSPKIEGRILQALSVKPTDKVLEIGTGVGYLTALLAKQAKQVDSIELHAKLSLQASKNLAAHKIKNVKLSVGDGTQGLAAKAPYDVIVFTGALATPPNQQLEAQLALGGRMFVVVGEPPAMEAILVERIASDIFKRDALFETCLPLLANAPIPSKFSF
jgi:protein-L-isoaspartate(D-aspartate) O-methyltransferase